MNVKFGPTIRRTQAATMACPTLLCLDFDQMLLRACILLYLTFIRFSTFLLELSFAQCVLGTNRLHNYTSLHMTSTRTLITNRLINLTRLTRTFQLIRPFLGLAYTSICYIGSLICCHLLPDLCIYQKSWWSVHVTPKIVLYNIGSVLQLAYDVFRHAH